MASSNDQAEKTEEEEPILQLPEASGDSSIPSIKLGDSIKFDAMGPVIINSDGSTRQIANWDKMTEHEQQVAWRRIAKRNEERRQALLEQQQQQQQQEQAMNDKKEWVFFWNADLIPSTRSERGEYDISALDKLFC